LSGLNFSLSHTLVYGIILSPVDDFVQPFELNYTNSSIGGVWDLPRVPKWPLGALLPKMAKTQLL